MLLVIPFLKHAQNKKAVASKVGADDSYLPAEAATAEAETMEIEKLVKAIKNEKERPAAGLFELFIN